jgi:hypothetical protein
MSKQLEDVLAEAEIKELHVRYCRANDRLDEALMRSLFHPGAIIELHQPFELDPFIALWRAVLGRYTVTWHHAANQLVEVDGDVAWAENYTISTHRIAADDNGPERDFVNSGRYIDRVERRGGVWKFVHRTMLVDFARTDPVPPAPPLTGARGARDQSDASYALRLRSDATKQH